MAALATFVSHDTTAVHVTFSTTFLLDKKQKVNMRDSTFSHVLRLCLTLSLLARVAQCAVAPQTEGQPWPMPQSYLPGKNVQSLNSDSFRFNVVGKDCDILQDAIVRYFKIIFRTTVGGNAAPLYGDGVLRFHPRGGPEVWGWEQDDGETPEGEAGGGTLRGLDLEVGQQCADLYPSLDMDESCM